MLQMVNGYVCRDAIDVELAKKGIDPVHAQPRIAPFWPRPEHGDEVVFQTPPAARASEQGGQSPATDPAEQAIIHAAKAAAAAKVARIAAAEHVPNPVHPATPPTGSVLNVKG